MTSRSWAPAAGLIAVALGLAYWLGSTTDAPSQSFSGDRLGPESGQVVRQYLEQTAVSLAEASADEWHWALVSPSSEWTPDQVWARLSQVAGLDRIARVLIRVPIAGVQSPTVEVATGQSEAGVSAANELAALSLPGVVAPGERGAAVARVSALRLRAGAPAVVGVVVRGTGEALRAVGALPGVRSVDVAPPDALDLAVAPLLPSFVDRAAPGADDAPVPTR